MTVFEYRNDELTCEQLPLSQIARVVGTPVYVYSRAALRATAVAYGQTPGLVCFAVKANGNPALLRLLGKWGLGADVTGGGELFLAQHAGIPAQRTIFSGVGKTRAEIETAVGRGVRALHVESVQELERVAATAAALQRVATIGVRVNPDIHAATHPAIRTGTRQSKFGVAPETAVALLRAAADHPWLRPAGLSAHIGSQIIDLAPFVATAEFLVQLAAAVAAAGVQLAYLDVGGGLGIGPDAPAIAAWVAAVAAPVRAAGYALIVEPGRSVVAAAGALLTQVLYAKTQGDKRFAVVDAGMNDLLRPALYGASHPVLPVNPSRQADEELWDVVGPVCETGDWLAKAVPLPALRPGDLLAVLDAGAYGFAMSSNYNGRLRPAEVLVDGRECTVIRRRQSYEHLLDGCP